MMYFAMYKQNKQIFGRKLGILTILLILALNLLTVSCALQPTGPATLALMTDSLVMVETGKDYITFRPKMGGIQGGFVFYPGGLVNEQAYSPLCRGIAAAGYFVALVPMPLNLAVFAPEKGRIVLTDNKQITRWAIGGHSLGGAMASTLVARDSTLFRGLVLYASYPAEADNLSKRTQLQVLSISASLDGLATPDKIKENKKFLPPSTQYIVLDGGNHAQFGSYGKQNGDNVAIMSAEEQLRRTLAATVDFMRGLK
jgi:Alpha/beta hydrolase family